MLKRPAFILIYKRISGTIVHDPAEQGHDKYNLFLRLSSFSFNSEQTQVVRKINFIIVLSSSLGFTYCYCKLE